MLISCCGSSVNQNSQSPYCTLLYLLHYPFPKLPQQINIKENGAIQKETERARRMAVRARLQNYWKQDNEWALVPRKHNERACGVQTVELWTSKTPAGNDGLSASFSLYLQPRKILALLVSEAGTVNKYPIHADVLKMY